MPPWRPLGCPWAPTLLREAPRSPPRGALGRPGGPKKFVVRGWGASWGEKLIDFRPPGGPRRLPEELREAIFEAILAAGPWSTKKVRKNTEFS